MNEKGFTLTELLATIAILLLIVSISIPSIAVIRSNNDEKFLKEYKDIIINAADSYMNLNTLSNPTEACYNLKIDTLIKEKLLKKIDTDSEYLFVIVTKEDGTYKYALSKESNATCSMPELKDNTVVEDKELMFKYTDPSGANDPKLADGMIPVTYNGENWVVADKTVAWYNYGEQKWANAVTVSDASLRNATSGTLIPMNVINSMWVWIPRYKYKITSNLGSATTTPTAIDVVFESGIETTGTAISSCSLTATNCYYTHPAFRNGSSAYSSTAYDKGGWDKELEGIWVGKFEMSGNSSTPTIKPDITNLRISQISTQFLTSLKFANGTMNQDTGVVTFSVNENNVYGLNTTSNTTDTHMMKNTEWGAVAILSQSIYGKYGNPNYEGVNKEIYINNSSSTYTGRSGGAPSGSTPINGTYTDQTSTTLYNTYGFYTYDDYLLNYGTNTKGNKVAGKGTGASTTGTIYVIYDMSGGSYENVMGNWAGYSGYNSSSNSGFNGTNGYDSTTTSGISFPTLKYYDKYTGTSSTTITSVKAIKGDATYETMNWYLDYNISAFINYPWFMRGGYYYHNTNVSTQGIFYTHHANGNEDSYRSFRSTLIP